MPKAELKIGKEQKASVACSSEGEFLFPMIWFFRYRDFCLHLPFLSPLSSSLPTISSIVLHKSFPTRLFEP